MKKIILFFTVVFLALSVAGNCSDVVPDNRSEVIVANHEPRDTVLLLCWKNLELVGQVEKAQKMEEEKLVAITERFKNQTATEDDEKELKKYKLNFSFKDEKGKECLYTFQFCSEAKSPAEKYESAKKVCSWALAKYHGIITGKNLFTVLSIMALKREYEEEYGNWAFYLTGERLKLKEIIKIIKAKEKNLYFDL